MASTYAGVGLTRQSRLLLLLCGLMAITALLPADATARRVITPEFDARGSLRLEGRDVSLGGPLTCDQGNAWAIDVEVSQGAARETAVARGMCSGDIQEWRGRVGGDQPGTFEPGPARACGRLVATDARGEVTQRRRWCTDITLASETVAAAPGGGEDDDDEEDTVTIVALIVGGLGLLLALVTFTLTRRRGSP